LNSSTGGSAGGAAQKYCAESLKQLLTACSKAPTCNDDDGPCPYGKFCFSAICNGPSKPTMKPTIAFLNTSTDSSSGGSISGDTSDGHGSVNPQNYCSKSEAELELGCATAQTCNDNDGPCPSGSFCFGNYSCSSNQSYSSGSTTNPSLKPTTKPSLKPTTKPTPNIALKPTSSKDLYVSLISTTAQSKPQVDTQHYCAKSAAELERTCASASTCNEGDGPCQSGSFCFPNVLCEASSEAEPPALTPISPVGHNIIDHDTTAAFTGDPECDYLCLQPIAAADCEHVLYNMDILPCTGSSSEVNFDTLCTGTGRCGTNLGLNNCPDRPDSKNIYVRLDSLKCEEHGFAYGSGVIDDDNIDSPPHIPNIGLESDETDTREALPNSSLGDDVEYGTFSGNSSNSTGLTGWWKKEPSAAKRACGGWIIRLFPLATMGLGILW